MQTHLLATANADLPTQRNSCAKAEQFLFRAIHSNSNSADWITFRASLSIMHSDACKLIQRHPDETSLLSLFSSHCHIISSLRKKIASAYGVVSHQNEYKTIVNDIQSEFQLLRGTHDAIFLLSNRAIFH